MDEKDSKKKELQSRREFFKKAAKGLLPMIGAISFGPIIFTSCAKDDPVDSGCRDCSAVCSSTCLNSCQGDCSGSCNNGCSSICSNSCGSSAQNSPSSNGDGSFSNPFNATEAHELASSLSADEKTSKSYYVKGKVSSVRYNYSVEYGTAVFFMTDEGKSEDIFQVYSAYYLENKPYTTGALLAVGDSVVVFGKMCNYRGTTPELAEKSGYLYSLNGRTSIGGDTCSGCASTCSSTCSGECSTTCTGGCGSSCSGECTGDCNTTCTASCADDCESGCSDGCKTGCTTACSRGCSEQCTGECSGGCQRTCTSTCANSCYNSCAIDCSGRCDNTCYSTCTANCRSTCNYPGCSGTCQSSCIGGCGTSCSYSSW